jgi:cytidyltransferase-like protein
MAKLNVHVFDMHKPTALLVGRFQPFHDGHKALVARAVEEVGQVCIALRDCPMGPDDPYTLDQRMTRIRDALAAYEGRYVICILPNITKVVVGRKPGYTVEHYIMGPEVEAISATAIRAEEGKCA